MNRREHIYTSHPILRSDACNIFSRNVSAKVSVEPLAKFRTTLPPTFLFLLYAIVKEQAVSKSPPKSNQPAMPHKTNGKTKPENKSDIPAQSAKRNNALQFRNNETAKQSWPMGAFGNRQRRPALVVPSYRPPTPKLSTPILNLL